MQRISILRLPQGRETFRYSTKDGLVESADSGLNEQPENDRPEEVEVLDAEGDIAPNRVDSVNWIDLARVARVNGESTVVRVL